MATLTLAAAASNGDSGPGQHLFFLGSVVGKTNAFSAPAKSRLLRSSLHNTPLACRAGQRLNGRLTLFWRVKQRQYRRCLAEPYSTIKPLALESIQAYKSLFLRLFPTLATFTMPHSPAT